MDSFILFVARLVVMLLVLNIFDCLDGSIEYENYIPEKTRLERFLESISAEE